MTNVESGLEKDKFSKQKCEGKEDHPVTRDGTRLASSRVSKQGGNQASTATHTG